MPRIRIAAGLAAILLSACGREALPIGRLAGGSELVSITGPGFQPVELRLEVSGELPEGSSNPTVFVHLLNERKEVVRTFDHPIPGQWWVGEVLRSEVLVHLSALAALEPPGEYRLTAGLYDLERGKFALATALPRVAKMEYEIARVVLSAPPSGSPTVELEGDWLPAEPDRDRQVLGSRALGGAGRGSVVIAPVTADGELLLRVALPGSDSPLARVELASDATEAEVVATCSCSAEALRASGGGMHDLIFAIPEPTADGACRVDLETNFRVRPRVGGAAYSVVVQALSWNGLAAVGSDSR